jgi:hypothetical protein
VDAFNVQFPLYSLDITRPMDLQMVNLFDAIEMPEVVERLDSFNIAIPDSPPINAPPAPEDFWASLDDMHSQLSSFDVRNYLSDDVQIRVDGSLRSFEEYLEHLRNELNYLFADNIYLMYDINAQYNFFLEMLRFDAYAAAAAEQTMLQEAIEEFIGIVENNREDTFERLGDFATMIPQSRAATGVNPDLVDFAVSPFEFVPMSPRDLAGQVQQLSFQHQHAYTAAVSFRFYQTVTLVAAGCLVLASGAIATVSHVRRKRSDK